MKKLMTLMLALSFLAATVAVSFADEPQAGHRQEEEGQEEKDRRAPKAVVR